MARPRAPSVIDSSASGGHERPADKKAKNENKAKAAKKKFMKAGQQDEPMEIEEEEKCIK